MKKNPNKTMLSALPACALLFAAAEGLAVTISTPLVRQLWPWSPDVAVEYAISGTQGKEYKAVLTAFNGGTRICEIPDSVVSGGSVFNTDGLKKITFDPSKATELAGIGALDDFRVQVSLVGMENYLYKIIDLTKSPGEAGQEVDVSIADLTNNLYGTWLESPPSWVDSNYVTNTFQKTFIWTGVTSDTAYATTKLVLRRIPAGSYLMGSPSTENGRTATYTDARETQTSVTISRSFYIGVFPFTQEQWYHVSNAWNECYFTNMAYRARRPVEQVNYVMLRGTKKGIRWPYGKSDTVSFYDNVGYVDEGSFIAQLQTKTGYSKFDLPSSAQYEYAARAGTFSALYTGKEITVPAGVDPEVKKIGRFQDNGGYCQNALPLREYTTNWGTASVGSYLPNAWGLYDMEGNVMYWCLDWFSTSAPSGGMDPSGSTTSEVYYRVRRGGGFDTDAANLRSAFVWRKDPYDTSSVWSCGFRIVLHE